MAFKFKYKNRVSYVMDITADQIQQTCAGAQVIEQQISTILKTFQSEIIEASKNGYTQVVVAVPTNFNIVGMDNKTAQTIVYHSLIETVEKKGFKVRLSLKSSAVTYCIKWDITKKHSGLNNMRNIIASHMITSKDDDD